MRARRHRAARLNKNSQKRGGDGIEGQDQEDRDRDASEERSGDVIAEPEARKCAQEDQREVGDAQEGEVGDGGAEVDVLEEEIGGDGEHEEGPEDGA